MFIRPQRYRVFIAFLLGLAISVCLLIGGFLYYKAHQAGFAEEMQRQISEKVISEYQREHPFELAYVFSKDKKAGEIIRDIDLIPVELVSGAVPKDIVTSLEDAVGKVMRCDILANTVASGSLFFLEGEYPDDLRVMEYTVINLPQKLETGNSVDVRVMFPNGLDYIVLSKKKVMDYTKGENGEPSIVWFHLSEEEILRMSSAIVDASLIEGSRLYSVTYVAPDIQKDAIKTYPANNEVLELIKTNPNIVTKAVETLEIRNREAFEERINKDLETAGRNKPYGPEEYSTHPVAPSKDSSGNESQSEESGTVEKLF